MDDFYIIHEDKGFLKEMEFEIEKLAARMGLSLNRRKTQICRIDRTLTFLKLRTRLTDTGKVVRIPCKANITRERRKLAKFKAKGLPFEDILGQYKSWRGGFKRYEAYRTIDRMDEVFMETYKEEMGCRRL